MKDRPINRPSLDEMVNGIDQSNRILLSRAITIIESKLSSDQELAAKLLDQIIPKTGKSIRIGITGVPGVGKSTFIDSFGSYLTSVGKKVAVLSIDPSSSLTRGSILGDKTRMNRLSTDPNAYIRPSPSGTSLGGVAQKTRETILLCEAAGYDVIIVETVGVGQSETAVKDMVDFFLLLMLAGGGDELQGIKRGIMEMADALVINKADGNNIQPAKRAKKNYKNALHLLPPHEGGWTVPVELCSAVEETGIDSVWQMVQDFESTLIGNNYLIENRRRQNLKWMHELIKLKLEESFYHNPAKIDSIQEMEKKVTAGELSVRHAVTQLFS
ncbi:MAG: methylmalonyl Co-A mutase-associated GTPase MeaB [Flammeovirgaceae bacterium]|nr:methylmalonyl Co-A mutase-associated GTPase MeaB [Flammeovirgaceae bacterium]MBR09242.1 methylmalonyl Co-A mutase-associated GTPase MeaB [Rickettsiales bacterium]|tara:strand:- start:10860 stop:11843 length:984 start_codon:yes stop_codon:yes gene_type:complete